MTSYEIVYKAPTRVNYWSHDHRSFTTSGGLSDMKVYMNVYTFVLNGENQFLDVNGNVLPYTYTEGAALPKDAAFTVIQKDITEACYVPDAKDSPLEVWENESKAQFGDEYVSLEEVIGENVSKETYKKREQQEMNCEHKNKYTVPVYYYPNAQDDPQFMLDGQPVYVGDYNIYIAVKGDYNLDNRVDSKDAMETLKYYADTRLGYTHTLSNDPELDGEDGLIFYLINVMYRQTPTDGSKRSDKDPLEDPPKVTATDSQCILMYYGDRVVAGYYETTWESVVGYDLLDSFYGDNYQ